MFAITILSVIAGVADASGQLSADQVVLTAAEALALASVLRTVIVPLMKRLPFWRRLPKPARRTLIVAVTIAAAILENVASGKPPALSAMLAVTASAGALLGHEADKKSAAEKDAASGPS